MKPHVRIAESAEDACKDAEAIVICTEWDEFKELDWEKSEFGRQEMMSVANLQSTPTVPDLPLSLSKS